MTDITKFKNVSLSREAYDKADCLSKKLFDVEISKTQVITLGINLVEYLLEKKLFNQIQTVPFKELKQRIEGYANPNIN